MRVNVVTLQTMFQTWVRYQMPLSQRRYVWELGRQWEPLWNDVQDVAEHRLAKIIGTPKSAGAEEDSISLRDKHFLGAVVLHHKEANQTGRVARPLVVDGQQRLTTFQLFLKAAASNFESTDPKAADRIREFTENRESIRSDEDDQFKVWPTEVDQTAFKYAMTDGSSKRPHGDSKIVDAKEYFHEKNRKVD